MEAEEGAIGGVEPPMPPGAKVQLDPNSICPADLKLSKYKQIGKHH